MKDKILDIVAEHCVGWKNCEALTEKLFALYNVVGQSGQLLTDDKLRTLAEERGFKILDETNGYDW